MKNGGILEINQHVYKDAIIFFANNLKSTLSDNLIQLILFGSQARGESNKDSDYDFLVILKKKDKEFINKLRAVELNFMDTFDSLAACLVYEETEWEKRKNFPIGKNIRREGIIL